MARSTRTKPVTALQARPYLAKAEELLAVAEDCLAAERYIGATGNSVHAAINAADAVCALAHGNGSRLRATPRRSTSSVRPGATARSWPGTSLGCCR